MLPEQLTIRGLRSTVRRVVAAVVDELRQGAGEPARPAKRWTRPPDTDRRIKMLDAYREGASLRLVGQQFGISGSRVQQILQSMPDYQAARDSAKSNRKNRSAGARSTRQQSSHKTTTAPTVKRSWKEVSERDEVFERLYQMRVAGKKWKDLAEAVGRPPDRSNAHATMLHMKRLARARGRPWPIMQADGTLPPSGLAAPHGETAPPE